MSGGAFAIAAPLYVVDISDARLRGALSSVMPLMLTGGILGVNALGIGAMALSWRAITAACCAPSG